MNLNVVLLLLRSDSKFTALSETLTAHRFFGILVFPFNSPPRIEEKLSRKVTKRRTNIYEFFGSREIEIKKKRVLKIWPVKAMSLVALQ